MMEKYDDKIKTVIPRPELDVSVSNPFALVGDDVTLDTVSKWVRQHHYSLDSGNGVTEQVTIPSVIGKSSRTINIKEKAVLEQSISIENSSDSNTSVKRIYAMQAQELPYFDISVSKEIIRTDGEVTRIRITPENGYAREHTVVIRVYKENESETPSYMFTNTLQDNGFKYVELSFTAVSSRGIYDVEADMVDTLSGMRLTKRVNKLITVTPKLATRADAYEFIIPNAKKATDVNEWQLDGRNYPAGSTIVLKADPNEPVGYAKRLKFVNFKGTWDNPYIVTIDQDTPLTIDWYYYFGINIGGASEHMVFDGRGYQNIENGIKFQIYNGENAVSAFSIGDLSHEMELFEIEIEGTNFAGFFIKTDPDINKPETWYGNFNFNRLLLHHNYIHDTDSEGCYLGHYSTATKTGNNNKGQYVTYRAHHLYDCRVYRNDYINNGYDALQFNNAENLEICYNRFINSGYRNEPDQTSVMSLSLSGKIYNNICLDYSGPCIQFGALGSLEIFNNVFANGSPTGSGLYLLASEDTPEQNPNNQMWNEIPVIIHNNVIMAKSGGGLGARNTTQFRNVQLIDNFVVTYNGVLCGGQSAATVELWKAAAKGNVLITQKVDDYPALDEAYQFGDSAGGDYRVASSSPLIENGIGTYFKFDYRGYKNWFASIFPVGSFMGIYKLESIDESFRILSLVFDNDVIQTINGYVMVGWTYYGNSAITEYRISESPVFEGAQWKSYSTGQVRYDFAGIQKGKKTIYVQLKNENNQITETFSKEVTWIYRTAMIGVNATTNISSDGVFNADTGIIYLRFYMKAGSIFNFKDSIGNKMGTVVVDKSYTIYASGGLAPGDNSAPYPDIVLQSNEAVLFDSTAGTFHEPTIFTFDIDPGKYRVSVLCNSNRSNQNDTELLMAAPYFKFDANGIKTSAALLKNNYETLVSMDNVVVGQDRILTLSAYWDKEAISAVTKKGQIYGAVNLIKIEEI